MPKNKLKHLGPENANEWKQSAVWQFTSAGELSMNRNDSK